PDDSAPYVARAGSAALRQRVRLVVAGDFGAAIEDPGAPLGDGAMKGDDHRQRGVFMIRSHKGFTAIDATLKVAGRAVSSSKGDLPIIQRYITPRTKARTL